MASGRSEHWSDFWASGALTSLPQDFSGNYDGELAAFWQREFEALPPSARLLDVCTGNGALAVLAAEYSARQARSFHITGLDAARLQPRRMAESHPEAAAFLEPIRFIDQTPLESASFPAGQFDFIMSQYGIEYCDWPRAAERVARWLSSGGCFSLVAHAADSAMIERMGREEAEYDWLEQQGLMPALAQWLAAEIDATVFRQSMAALQPVLEREAKKRRSPLLANALNMAVATARMDEAAMQRREQDFRGFHQQLRLGRARLRDFLRVNRAIAADRQWYRPFLEAGLRLRDSGDILYHGRHHAGRFYRFQKDD